ncbi:MAG: S8 family serine peptidase [Lachnospiraceae bacterium]|nr:S8 family serine peptidase [Lachnospiraceae bacterium]
MKKAKLLSLFLAGSLLFHTAGMDALATTISESALAVESVDETGDESAEEISNEESPEQSSNEDEEISEEPIEDDGETEGPSEDGENPEKPSEDGENPEEPSEDEENPEEPSEDEENPEEPSEDEEIPEEPSEDGEITEEPIEEDGEIEEPSEDAEGSDDTISENTISENDLPDEEEDVFDIFPGLGDSYAMSSQQMADKRELAAHVGDIVKKNTRRAEDYPDAEGLYELGEVVYLAESEEEAEQIAEAFGGTVDSYSYEVAVISLPEEATVAMAVAAAAEPDLKLPAVWPNYYNYLDSELSETNAIGSTKATDAEIATQWQHDYIGTRYAWAAGFTGANIKVAVIDTGVEKGHEDLSANAESGRNFVGGAAGTPQDTDNDTHGTHVAGIIAADDNGKGGVGIAPDAKVRGYCVFPTGGSANSADVMSAIRAAVEDGNDIINMSLGSPMYDGAYAKVVQEAYSAGVAVFASSGNDDTNGYNFPASYPGAISVGAVDQNSARASFSNYGSAVKLSFPGVRIYSTLPNNTYGYMSGTSQASPAAAGTAAVILSARDDIKGKSGKAKVDALLSAMKSSTTKCTNSGMGAGTTWLPGALKIATDMTAPDAPVIEFDKNLTPTDKAGKTYKVKEIEVTLSTKTAVGVEIYYTTDGKSPSYKNGQIVVGEKYSSSFKVGGAKNKTVKAIAVNPVTGKVSKVASKACVLTPIPENVILTAANGVSKIAAGKSLKLTAAVEPSYAISNKVAWTVVDADGKDAAAKNITVTNGTVKTFNTKSKVTDAGEYTVKATAVGEDGKTLNGKVGEYKITVLATTDIKKVAFIDKTTNKAPKAQSINIGGAELNLLEYLVVTKTDNSTLDQNNGADAAVVWSSSNTKIATVSNGKVTAVAPGKAVIKATSNDGGNKSASYNVTVNQPVTSITISGPQKAAAGKSISLIATLNAKNPAPTNKKLDWKVEGNDKVTVNANGKVTVKKDAAGTCTVTATAKDGSGVSSAPYSITIVSGAITKITLSDKSVVLFPPKTSATAPTTKTLTATVVGSAGVDNTLIEWKSSAPSIANVDQSGVITAKSSGKATITCAATDGSNKKATCTVNVTVPMSKLFIGPADSFGDYYTEKDDNGAITFDGYSGYIASGKSIKMSAKYTSNYGTPTNKKVVWKSSNENILTVDKNGKVTAKKDAPVYEEAVITATAADGSGVTSNNYTFVVTPLFKRLTIENGLVAVGWTADGKGYTIPYYTITVSGGKNPGLSKSYNKEDGCYYFSPVPGRVTTNKPSSVTTLYTNELEKMTVTVKLRDGSGVSGKISLYVARFSDGKIKFFK